MFEKLIKLTGCCSTNLVRASISFNEVVYLLLATRRVVVLVLGVSSNYICACGDSFCSRTPPLFYASMIRAQSLNEVMSRFYFFVHCRE